MASGAVKRERTCIGCGAKTNKGDLLRIVRRPVGPISFDERGTEAGRGAYVCSQACFDKAVAGGKLQRALRTPVSQEDAQRVRVEIQAVSAERD